MKHDPTKSNLPPDPEGLNNDRAGWAADALITFCQSTGGDMQDAVSDLLSDLGHWCDRNSMDFTAELQRAATHYKDETGGKQLVRGEQ